MPPVMAPQAGADEYRPLAEIVHDKNGKPGLDLNFHKGQLKAWDSEKRIIPVLAGTQGGKTSFGTYWLRREIGRRGPGDYLVVTPTYPLLQLKLLPEFLKLFEKQMGLGSYVGGSTKIFTFSKAGEKIAFGDPEVDADGYEVEREPTRIIFGHAQDPDSLESATAKAAWLDEAGQKKFKASSWEAIRRRVSLNLGRILLTTTPYNLGWLKTQLFDPWNEARKRGEEHPEIEVVRFKSTANPFFPDSEMVWARENLPYWRYAMMYLARFTRPAGMIYDAFAARHKVEGFIVPDSWKRYIGLDFGGTNTAAVYLAEDPSTLELFCYRTYLAGNRTAAQHAAAMLQNEPVTRGWSPPQAVGGAGSEGQWRHEFATAGLPIMAPPVTDVEVGINRVYSALTGSRLKVMEDLDSLLDEFATYSRELDDDGQPTEKIEDKSDYHLLDAMRYILSHLQRPGIAISSNAASGATESAEPIAHGTRTSQATRDSGEFFDLPDFSNVDTGDLFT